MVKINCGTSIAWNTSQQQKGTIHILNNLGEFQVNYAE